MEKETLEYIAKKASETDASELDHRPLMFKPSDKAYNALAGYMPESLKKRPMFLAFTAGAATSFAVSYGIRKGLEAIAGPSIVDGYRKAITAFEIIFPFAYSAILPEKAKSVVSKHPVFTAGWSGVWLGFISGLYAP